MYKTTMVICDFGFFPGYITLLIYIAILVLLQIFVINPIAVDKNKITTKLAKVVTKYINKTNTNKLRKILPIIIVSIILFTMFLLYPLITRKYCTHKFWQFLGFNVSY